MKNVSKWILIRYLLLAIFLFPSIGAQAQMYVPDQRYHGGQAAEANKANTFNKNQTWLGTGNSVGTITSGIWNGSVIGSSFGGAGSINGALKGNGSGTVSQAACADLSNGATGCSTATGTSGATIPLLNGNNVYSGTTYFNQSSIWTALHSDGNSGTSLALNIDNGPMQSTTITGAVTITLATPTHAGRTTVIITQDGSGHVYSITGCKWPAGSAITYSTAASTIDVVSILYDGTNFYCMGGAGFN